jgi:hypothetical protein
MKRKTLFLEEATERELRLPGQREKLPVAALVRDALGRYLDKARCGKELRLCLLAAGRSAHHNTAERAEELFGDDLRSRDRLATT